MERRVVVEHPGPERRQGRQARERPVVGAAHLQIGLQPHLGEQGGGVVGPVLQRRPLARHVLQLAGREGAERAAREVDVPALALGEVHRHVQRPRRVGFESEAVLEDEVEQARAVRICVGPDVGAGAEEA